MIFWGYLFTVLSYGCFCLSRFMKRKVMILTLDLLAKILTILGLYCFHSLSGAYVFMAVFVMLIVVNIKERLHAKWLFGYLFFQTVYLVVLYYTYIGISSILVIFCTSVTLFANWWLPPQLIRLVGGWNGILFLIYQLSIGNWAGLLEVFAIGSSLLAFIKYRRKRRQCKSKAEISLNGTKKLGKCSKKRRGL